MSRTTRPVLALLVGAALVASSGCASAEPVAEATADPSVEAAIEASAGTVFEGTIAEDVALEGVEVWLGSPEGAEGDATDALLAEITMAALRSAGADVIDETEMGPGFLLRDSLLSGEIDVYWEGIGDAWTAILRQPADGLTAADIQVQLNERDLAENGVVWLPAASFDDGPRFAVGSEVASEEGLEFLSDLGQAIVDDEAEVICVTAAFVTFPTDGRVAVEEALEVTLPDEVVREYEPEPIYPETGEGTCRFGLVEASSGRIPEYELTVLTDDVGAFLPNPPAPAVREDVIREHPDLAILLGGLAARLTPDVIQSLNRQVVLDGVDAGEVARLWLEDEGLVTGA